MHWNKSSVVKSSSAVLWLQMPHQRGEFMTSTVYTHIRTNMVAMKYMRKQCVPGNLSPPPPPYLGTRLLPGMQLQETFGCSFTVDIYPSWITSLCKFYFPTHYLCDHILIMLFIITVIIWGCFSSSVLPPLPIAYMVHPCWTPRLIETPNSILWEHGGRIF